MAIDYNLGNLIDIGMRKSSSDGRIFATLGIAGPFGISATRMSRIDGKISADGGWRCIGTDTS